MTDCENNRSGLDSGLQPSQFQLVMLETPDPNHCQNLTSPQQKFFFFFYTPDVTETASEVLRYENGHFY